MGVRKSIDLTGQRFGRLTVTGGYTVFTRTTPSRKKYRYLWDCTCDCGTKCMIDQKSLLSGRTQSCGCLKSERVSVSSKRMQNTPDKVERRNEIARRLRAGQMYKEISIDMHVCGATIGSISRMIKAGQI